VHEHIVAVFGRDKAETLAFVEPLDFALGHRLHPPFFDFLKGGLRRRQKKNHHSLEGVVVKPTLQNVFIQPLIRPEPPKVDSE
jgi:hypothetical protein